MGRRGGTRASRWRSSMEGGRRKTGVGRKRARAGDAVYFFHEKVRLRHEHIAPMLGFTHYFSRNEYQWRKSIHEHEFLWHPGFPSLAALTMIMNEAKELAGKPGNAGFAESWCQLMNKMAGESYDVTQAAAWIGRFLDVSNSFWDVKEKRVRPSGQGHPSGVDPTAGGRPVSLTDAEIAAYEQDYAKLRTCTGRHSECAAGYCLRKNKSGEEYCRFAKSMETHEPNKPHFRATVSGSDTNPVAKWDFYMGPRDDPRIGCTMPVFGKYMRANTDCKFICDIMGAAQYLNKAIGYATKEEKKSDTLKGSLSARINQAEDGESVASVLKKTLNSILDRDFGAQELGAISLKLPSTVSSHQFVHAVIGDKRAVTKAEDEMGAAIPGELQLRGDELDMYWIRLAVYDAGKPAALEFDAKFKDVSLNYVGKSLEAWNAEWDGPSRDALRQTCFTDFLRFYKFGGIKGRPKRDLTREGAAKYFVKSREPGSEEKPRIAVIWPRYPKKMRAVDHAHHETYCKHRLVQFMAFDDEQHFRDYVAQHHGSFHCAYSAFALTQTPDHPAFRDILEEGEGARCRTATMTKA